MPCSRLASPAGHLVEGWQHNGLRSCRGERRGIAEEACSYNLHSARRFAARKLHMYGRRIFCFHNSGLKVCYSRSPHHSCGCGSGVHLGSSSVALSFAFLPVEEVSHKKGRGQGPDNKSARFALLHNGSPFGDPGPHGDIFGDLGPPFMLWVPFFNFRLKNAKISSPYYCRPLYRVLKTNTRTGELKIGH